MEDRKGMEPNGKRGVKELITVEERETLIRISYVRGKKYIFNKGKNKF